MAVQTFKLKSSLNKTDKITTSFYPFGLRVRPNEMVEVDLVDAAQDAAFTQADYDVVVDTPAFKPFTQI